eukprot:scaffold731_cov261-Pinguiococcus_pyrenoidosus.AAC.61
MRFWWFWRQSGTWDGDDPSRIDNHKAGFRDTERSREVWMGRSPASDATQLCNDRRNEIGKPHGWREDPRDPDRYENAADIPPNSARFGPPWPHGSSSWA